MKLSWNPRLRCGQFVFFMLTMIWGPEACAQSFPPVWNSTASYAAGDIVQYGGNWYRAMTAITTHYVNPATTYGSWELNYARSNTTLLIGVGQSFSSLQNAWLFAHNARVADGAYVHFDIITTKGAFNETFTLPFSLDQGSGANMSIVCDHPANNTLTFSGSNGFTIDSGHAFGLLENLNLVGTPDYSGIYATNSASLTEAANCTVSGFGISCYASSNAALNLPDVFPTNFSTALYADLGGTISAPNVRALDEHLNLYTYGLLANRGGTIYADGATLAGVNSGALAENGGLVYAYSSFIWGCAYGCVAQNGGRVFVEYATFGMNAGSGATANQNADLSAYNAGIIDATRYQGTQPTVLGLGGDGSYVYT